MSCFTTTEFLFVTFNFKQHFRAFTAIAQHSVIEHSKKILYCTANFDTGTDEATSIIDYPLTPRSNLYFSLMSTIQFWWCSENLVLDQLFIPKLIFYPEKGRSRIWFAKLPKLFFLNLSSYSSHILAFCTMWMWINSISMYQNINNVLILFTP